MYVVSLDPEKDGVIIFINIVLLIGWVDSPNFFCAFLEILSDVSNNLVDTEFPVPFNGAITKS